MSDPWDTRDSEAEYQRKKRAMLDANREAAHASRELAEPERVVQLDPAAIQRDAAWRVRRDPMELMITPSWAWTSWSHRLVYVVIALGLSALGTLVLVWFGFLW